MSSLCISNLYIGGFVPENNFVFTVLSQQSWSRDMVPAITTHLNISYYSLSK